MKKILITILTVAIICYCCVGVFAAMPENAVPLWDNIKTMDCSLVFSETECNAKGTSMGQSGTTEMSGTLTVYRQTFGGWEEVGSDSDTVEGRRISLSVNFTGEDGGYYKAVFELTCVRNGVSESETKTSYASCIVSNP